MLGKSRGETIDYDNIKGQGWGRTDPIAVHLDAAVADTYFSTYPGGCGQKLILFTEVPRLLICLTKD